MNDLKSRPGRSTVSRVLAALGVPSCVWLLASTIACTADRPRDSIETAQIAVRANPALELIATDERQGVLTVRMKRTGQIQTVHAADVIAGTAFRDLESSTGAPTASSVSASSSSSSDGPGPRPAERATRAEVTAGGHRVAVQETPGGVTGRVVVGETQASASAGATRSLPPEATSEAVAPAAAAQSGAHVDESRLERRTRGVMCVGSEGVQLDGVLLRVEDAAIQVVGPCKVRILNSHIVGEIAVQVTGNGAVVIDNSIIEGRTAAFQLTGEAVVEVRASTVRGAVQSVQNAKVHDQGGNLWR